MKAPSIAPLGERLLGGTWGRQGLGHRPLGAFFGRPSSQSRSGGVLS